jgi:hypothetical protein
MEGAWHMKISRAVIGLVAALPLAVAATSASADTLTFDWTLSGPAASLGGFAAPGSGTLTVTTGSTPSAGDLITAITGNLGSLSITGLLPTGTVNNNDNLLFPSGTGPIDTTGIGIKTSGGNVSIFSFDAEGTPPTGNAYGESGPFAFGVGTFAITPAPVPLPPSVWMLALGLGGMLVTLRTTKRMTRDVVGAAAA